MRNIIVPNVVLLWVSAMLVPPLSGCGPVRGCDLHGVAGRLGVVFSDPLENVTGTITTTDRWGALARAVDPESGEQLEDVIVAEVAGPSGTFEVACDDGFITAGLASDSLGHPCLGIPVDPGHMPLQLAVSLTSPRGTTIGLPQAPAEFVMIEPVPASDGAEVCAHYWVDAFVVLDTSQLARETSIDGGA